jgi:transcriptional regulator with XRE-family HTH domain
MSRLVRVLLAVLVAGLLFPAAGFAVLDADADGIADSSDNCPTVANASQADFDHDQVGDACDADIDDDGWSNTSDAFPRDAGEQLDTDRDGIGNNADTDDDDDTVLDGSDNCPLNANVAQSDSDHDGAGDPCDLDRDGDGVLNASDAFPDDPTQSSDVDGDGIADPLDNCRTVSNATQADADGDHAGDACDTDRDGDGWLNTADDLPDNPNEHLDADRDGIGDNADTDDDNDFVPDTSDNCRITANLTQADLDGDHIGDACDTDIDGDGFPNTGDDLPLDPTEHVDTDHDGIGDNTDHDNDNDGWQDAQDAFPRNPAEHVDTDHDGIGDNADNCETQVNASQADLDHDGVGDVCDADTDGDTFDDDVDAFPRDPAEHVDTDRDGTGNNADSDDDGDGMPDLFDAFPLDAAEQGDVDHDGVGDLVDNCRTTANRSQADLDLDSLGDECDPDIDGDGWRNSADLFPADPNEHADTDGDGAGDRGDDCPEIPNPDQHDADGDGRGDLCDDSPNGLLGRPAAKGAGPATAVGLRPALRGDRDSDGVPDGLDAFPDDRTELVDSDGDGKGDAKDPCPTSAAATCRPAPGKPAVTRTKVAASSRGEVRVTFRLKRPALLRFVITHKWCGGPGCFSRHAHGPGRGRRQQARGARPERRAQAGPLPAGDLGDRREQAAAVARAPGRARAQDLTSEVSAAPPVRGYRRATMSVTTTRPPVGILLRDWRRRRRLSQLDLALEAGVSARHLSFVETGRSRPSAQMVLHLADQLEVPLRDRNGLLLAAGYAPEYGQRALDEPEMEPVRRALDLVLGGHDPYPAVVVDRSWTMVAGNRSVGVLTAGVAPELLQPPVNVLRLSLHPDGVAPRIVNLGEWRAHLLERLARQVSLTGDTELSALYDELAAYPAPEHDNGHATAPDIFVPLRLRTHDGAELAFFSTVATFGTAVDITVAELAIESFFPADAATAEALHAHLRRAG